MALTILTVNVNLQIQVFILSPTTWTTAAASVLLLAIAALMSRACPLTLFAGYLSRGSRSQREEETAALAVGAV
jgi:hypothetical protein